MMKTTQLANVFIIVSILLAHLQLVAQHDAKDTQDYPAVKKNHKNEYKQSKGKDWTPLMYAIDNGNYALTESLIEKGADINAINKRGYTPLFLAISEGEIGIVKLLLKKGVPINFSSKPDFTALHIACKEGQLDIVKLLLENGTDINKDSALMSAVSGQNYDVVNLVLQKGAIVNTNSKQLRYCCEDSSAISYKIEWTNWNPLLEAVHENDIEITQLLLKNGAAINSSASKTVHHIENSETITGWTPIFEAIENGNAQMIKLLFKNGIDKNSKLGTGETILQFALKLKNKAVIELIQSYY